MSNTKKEVTYMAIILYKARREDNKEWVKGYVVRPYSRDEEDNIKSYCFNTIDEKGWVSECIVEAQTICQYIGLEDANKEQMFEHDIIQIPGQDEYFHLKWEEDSARFVMESESLIVDFDNYWAYEVEVVGNIFDSAYMLELSAE